MNRMVSAAMCLFLAGGRAQAAGLADLLAGPSSARLTADSIAHYFGTAIRIENFSRDRCFPVLKATSGSSLPVAASFIGTTLHRPCSEPQKVVIIKLQFRSNVAARDTAALGDALRRREGMPCYSADDGRKPAFYWSDKDRVLGVSEGIDQGDGYTVTLFSRAALTPFEDAADAQAYTLWDGSAPAACQMARTK